MTLSMNRYELEKKISQKITNLNEEELENYFTKVFLLNDKLINFLKNDKVTGFENDPKIGIGSEGSGIMQGQGTNPLLWELGHLCYFYEYHCIKYFYKNYKFFIDNGDIYDSFITSREYRFKFKEHSKSRIFNYYEFIKVEIFKILNKKLSNQDKYLLTLTLLHNHMHCESLIFSKKLLGFENIFKYHISKNISNDVDFNFINISGGYFYQGTFEGENIISWDNELPRFKKYISNFKVSKYCVTESILLKFILDNGYKNKSLWSDNGWRYITDNNITLPFYWILENSKYKIKDNDKVREIINNYPANHISWYEAEAICKYLGGRLPTESEWEYLATNRGKTKFPWGDKMINEININYSGNICDVTAFKNSESYDGVRQLIGNVWEWCQEPLYPYDGFVIDPIYREFSYPFFGFKKILRGGSWAVPDILINSKYRNAQMPDCKIQFTGVRVVKD